MRVFFENYQMAYVRFLFARKSKIAGQVFFCEVDNAEILKNTHPMLKILLKISKKESTNRTALRHGFYLFAKHEHLDFQHHVPIATSGYDLSKSVECPTEVGFLLSDFPRFAEFAVEPLKTDLLAHALRL